MSVEVIDASLLNTQLEAVSDVVATAILSAQGHRLGEETGDYADAVETLLLFSAVSILCCCGEHRASRKATFLDQAGRLFDKLDADYMKEVMRRAKLKMEEDDQGAAALPLKS